MRKKLWLLPVIVAAMLSASPASSSSSGILTETADGECYFCYCDGGWCICEPIEC